MFDKFSGEARSAFDAARAEAQRFKHDHIGAEHLLLGLLKTKTGEHYDILRRLKIDREQLRRKIEEKLAPGSTPPGGIMPFTPDAKRVIEQSAEKAKGLGSRLTGPEHLLLSLSLIDDAVVGKTFRELGLTAAAVRAEVIKLKDADL